MVARIDDLAGPVPTNRISGGDRFATAAEVAQEFAAADRVYVANGRNYPDALSAAPAAGFLEAPLLLTERDSLPAVIADEIVRLQPDEIIVAGGLAVISQGVEDALEALYPGDQVTRIAGENRYETSRLISLDAFGPDLADPTGAPSAFIATGTNFPDALSASAAAAKAGGPVILVPGSASSVDATTLTLLEDLNTTDVYIAGGTGVVSSQIEAQLNGIFGAVNVARLAGANRYDTAVAINEALFATSSTVYLAVGTGYADALAGAALAGKNGAPLFVVPGTCVPPTVLTAIDDLDATTVVLFGGVGALSTAVADLTTCG